MTQTGLNLGTPQYMSPEQATGDRAIDARTDLFARRAHIRNARVRSAAHGGTLQAIIAPEPPERPRSRRARGSSVFAIVHWQQMIGKERGTGEER